MASWYFGREVLRGATASRSHGVDAETEARYRREGVQLIQAVCQQLSLYPYATQLSVGCRLVHISSATQLSVSCRLM